MKQEIHTGNFHLCFKLPFRGVSLSLMAYTGVNVCVSIGLCVYVIDKDENMSLMQTAMQGGLAVLDGIHRC